VQSVRAPPLIKTLITGASLWTVQLSLFYQPGYRHRLSIYNTRMDPCQVCGRSCATCFDLDLRRPHHKVEVYNSPIHLGKKSSSFRYDTRSLRQSATQGCKSCRLLLDGVSCFRNLWNGDETRGRITHTEGVPLKVSFTRWQDNKHTYTTDALQFYTVSGKLIPYNFHSTFCVFSTRNCV